MKVRVSGDKLVIASAHVLSKHSKCSRIHGHNYQIEVEVEGTLNEKKMIVDFSELKNTIKSILKPLDHKLLLPLYNKDFNIVQTEKEILLTTCEGKKYRFPKEDVELLPLEATTAELLAPYLHDLIKKQYPSLKVTVSVAETPSSVAIYSEEESSE